MVWIESVRQSNAQIANLPKGLVALFIGATSGIGESTLQQFTEHAPSPTIYTVARPSAVASHDNLLTSLREAKPTATYNLITADVSLISGIDKAVAAIKQKETKLDLLVLSTGFMPFEGRSDTTEGLDSSMTTRYYSRLRAVEQLLPLLNNAASPRIVSVLAGGQEKPINEEDLDLRSGNNWSYWNSSLHSATMLTLTFERIAQNNARLSIVHWYPGPVATPGLERAKKFGMKVGEEMSVEEAGARTLFFATSDRYAVAEGGGLVPLSDGLEVAKQSGGGIFLLDPQGESTDNEEVLAAFRERHVEDAVWDFAHKLFDGITAQV